MSSKDNSEGTAFALIAVGAIMLIFVIFFLVAAFAAGLSVLALWAFVFGRCKLGSKIDIERWEGFWFIARGLAGMWLVPVLTSVLLPVFFNQGIRLEWMPYLATGGYILGSIGGEWIRSLLEEDDQPAVLQLPIQETPRTDKVETPPYYFASWDDEEELK